MYWAKRIFELYFQERKSVPDIIKYFDNPLVNQEFVLTALENVRFLRRPPKVRTWNKRIMFHRPPELGTKSRPLYDHIESIGGKEKFAELIKTNTLTKLAKEWGFTPSQLSNYKRDYLTGRIEEARFRPKLRTAMIKRRKSTIRRAKKGGMKNLW